MNRLARAAVAVAVVLLALYGALTIFGVPLPAIALPSSPTSTPTPQPSPTTIFDVPLPTARPTRVALLPTPTAQPNKPTSPLTPEEIAYAKSVTIILSDSADAIRAINEHIAVLQTEENRIYDPRWRSAGVTLVDDFRQSYASVRDLVPPNRLVEAHDHFLSMADHQDNAATMLEAVFVDLDVTAATSWYWELDMGTEASDAGVTAIEAVVAP